MKKNRHILVTGSNRSGTTWVGTMLSLSPRVNYIFEPFSYQLKSAKLSKVDCPFTHYLHFVTPEEHDRAKKYNNCRLGKRPISWRKDFLENPTFRRFFGASYRYIKSFKEIFRNIERAVIKDPIALMSAEWMARTFECYVLVMIRHPAAYVESIKRVGWRTNPRIFLKQELLMDTYLNPMKDEILGFSSNDNNIIEEASLCWKIYHFLINIYKENHPEWVFLKHEDISRNPIKSFKYLYDKFSLPFTPDVSKTIQNYSGSHNPVDPTDKVHLLHRNSKKNIGRWKNTLSEGEIKKIYDRTFDIAEIFYSHDTWL